MELKGDCSDHRKAANVCWLQLEGDGLDKCSAQSQNSTKSKQHKVTQSGSSQFVAPILIVGVVECHEFRRILHNVILAGICRICDVCSLPELTGTHIAMAFCPAPDQDKRVVDPLPPQQLALMPDLADLLAHNSRAPAWLPDKRCRPRTFPSSESSSICRPNSHRRSSRVRWSPWPPWSLRRGSPSAA